MTTQRQAEKEGEEASSEVIAIVSPVDEARISKKWASLQSILKRDNVQKLEIFFEIAELIKMLNSMEDVDDQLHFYYHKILGEARLFELFDYVLECQITFPDSPLDIISHQLSDCSECMQLFHQTMSAVIRSSILSSSGRIEKWNLERQSSALRKHIADYQKLTSTTSGGMAEYRKWRCKIITILFELLNFPANMKHPEIASNFLQLLKFAQKKSKLKLNETERIYPGLVLLSFHKDGSCREWAHNSLFLLADSHNVRLNRNQLESISSILESIFGQIETSLGIKPADYNSSLCYPIMSSDDSEELWSVLCTLAHKIIAPSDILYFFGAACPNLDQVVLASFLDPLLNGGNGGNFYDRLHFLDLLFRHGQDFCQWVTLEKISRIGRALFTNILCSVHVQHIMSVNAEDLPNVDNKRHLAFKWIGPFISIFGCQPWMLEALIEVSENMMNWSSRARIFVLNVMIDFWRNDPIKGLDESVLCIAAGCSVQDLGQDTDLTHEIQTRIVQNIIKQDFFMIKSFRPSSSATSNVFYVREVFWRIIDRVQMSQETVKIMLNNILSISFRGPFFTESNSDAERISLYNASLKTVVLNSHLMFSSRLDDASIFDWKSILRFIVYNNTDWQFSAETHLMKNMGKHTLRDSIADLASKDKIKEKFYPYIVTLMQKVAEYQSNGSFISNSCMKMLEICSILGPLCYDQYKGIMLGNGSFWLRVHLFVYGVITSCIFWQKKNQAVYDLFKLCIRVLREYAGLHMEACKDQKEPILFYMDWAKETITKIKPWLLEDDNEINFLGCELFIDILKAVVEQRSITLTEDWKASLEFDVNSVKNHSQRLKIGDYLTPRSLKRPLSDEQSFYRYQKVIHVIPDDEDDAPVIIGSERPLKTTSNYHRNRYYPISKPAAAVPHPELIAKTKPAFFPIVGTSFTVPGKTYEPPAPSAMIIQPSNHIPYKHSTSSGNGFKSEAMRSIQREMKSQLPNHVKAPPKIDERPVERTRPEPEVVKQEFIPRRPIKMLELSTVNKSGRGPVSFSAPVSSKTAAQLISVKKLFMTVLGWDISSESQKNLEPLSKIPDSFKNAESYVGVFEPLFIEELRTRFVQGIGAAEARYSRITLLESVRNVDTLHEVEFSMKLSAYQNETFADNTLLLISPVANEKERICALVKQVKRKHDDVRLICHLNLKGRQSRFGNLVSLSSQWNVKIFMNLATDIREYEALSRLNSLALFQLILSPPNWKSLTVQPLKVAQYVGKLGVNEPQAMAIYKAIEQDSGFTLIQGPPGSGKTKTILGLIGAIQTSTSLIAIPTSTGCKQDRPRRKNIMVCAPSNAAIDEIARRLMAGIKNCSGEVYFPKLLRVGKDSSVHSDVKSIYLDYLLEKEMKADPKFSQHGNSKEISKDLKDLMDKKKLMDEEEKRSGIDNASELAALRSKIYATKKSEAERSRKLSSELEKLKAMLKNRILVTSDVVLCTLSSSGYEMFSDVRGLEFSTVIIDEACQAIELSTLIPLRYGCKKCILVGDPQQLPPTILSKHAAQFMYDQSLFQRLQKSAPDSVTMLSIQYRMHPAISQFPSSKFYNGLLQDAPNMLQDRAIDWHGKFKPFGFFFTTGREARSNQQSVYNLEEVEACVGLVRALAANYPGVNFGHRIGIISFYKEQIRKLKQAFRNAFGNVILELIDINTVDGFQGQEKDIIILSCVRSSTGGGVGFLTDCRRINVALTRARYSLMVVGDESTLKGDETWSALIQDAHTRQACQPLRLSDFENALANRNRSFENLYRAGARRLAVRNMETRE